MKRLSILILSMFFTAGIQAEESVNPFNVNPFALPDEYAEQLKGYRSSWERMTGFEYSGLHWNQFIVVYLNQDGKAYKNNYSEYLRYYQDFDEDDYDEDELPEPSFQSYSEGTIVLKENFLAANGVPDTPISITMMIKRGESYDPDSGNWEYVQFDPNGNVILRGNSSDKDVDKACANCHINIADRDYVFANYYSKPN